MISDQASKELASKLFDVFEAVTESHGLRIGVVEKMKGFCFYQLRDGINLAHECSNDVVVEYLVLKMINVLEFKKFNVISKARLYDQLLEQFMEAVEESDGG